MEIGRYITPYGVDTSVLERGIEIDVTDFKSMLSGTVELKDYIELWVSDGWKSGGHAGTGKRTRPLRGYERSPGAGDTGQWRYALPVCSDAAGPFEEE